MKNRKIFQLWKRCWARKKKKKIQTWKRIWEKKKKKKKERNRSSISTLIDTSIPWKKHEIRSPRFTLDVEREIDGAIYGASQWGTIDRVLRTWCDQASRFKAVCHWSRCWQAPVKPLHFWLTCVYLSSN